MPITTFTSREFNQDTSRAKQAASLGPVFITDRGRPAHVLLTIGDYEALACTGPSLAELLSSPETADFDFDVPKLHYVSKPADFD